MIKRILDSGRRVALPLILAGALGVGGFLSGCHKQTESKITKPLTLEEKLSEGNILAEEIPAGFNTLSNPCKLIKTIDEIPEIPIKIYTWEPLNIMGKVRCDLSGIHPQSNNERWLGVTDVHIGALLVDLRSDKAYPLQVDDEALLGFRQKIPKFPNLWNDIYMVGDNGMCLYGSKYNKRGEIDYVILADLSKLRKIVIINQQKDDITNFEYRTKLSSKLNMLVINTLDDFYILDLDKEKIIYTEKGFVAGMSYDGRVIVVDNDAWEGGFYDDNYWRVDTQTKEKKHMWGKDYTKGGFTFSPDTNYCIGWESRWGDDDIKIFVNNSNEHFTIDESDGDYFKSIDNDGTIHANGGIYKLRSGKYVRMPDKEQVKL